MTQYNHHTNRNYAVPAWNGMGMPPVVRQQMPAPWAQPWEQYDHRSYSDGFCDGFCEGVGKFLGLVTQAVPVIRKFK